MSARHKAYGINFVIWALTVQGRTTEFTMGTAEGCGEQLGFGGRCKLTSVVRGGAPKKILRPE